MGIAWSYYDPRRIPLGPIIVPPDLKKDLTYYRPVIEPERIGQAL